MGESAIIVIAHIRLCNQRLLSYLSLLKESFVALLSGMVY